MYNQSYKVKHEYYLTEKKMRDIQKKIEEEVFDIQKLDMVKKLMGQPSNPSGMGPIQILICFHNIISEYEQITKLLISILDYLELPKEKRTIMRRVDLDYISFWLSHPNRQSSTNEELKGLLGKFFPHMMENHNEKCQALVSSMLYNIFFEFFYKISSLRDKIPNLGSFWLLDNLWALAAGGFELIKYGNQIPDVLPFLYRELDRLVQFIKEKLFLQIREYDLSFFEVYTVSNQIKELERL